jgi:hypothetical protein
LGLEWIWRLDLNFCSALRTLSAAEGTPRRCLLYLSSAEDSTEVAAGSSATASSISCSLKNDPKQQKPALVEYCQSLLVIYLICCSRPDAVIRNSSKLIFQQGFLYSGDSQPQLALLAPK